MTTRRSFLKSSGILAAGAGISSLLPTSSMAAPTTNAPNDRVNVAVIGVGMGCVDLAGILSNEWVHCLGMCDILAHMANISYRTGTLVVYDPNTRKFVNNSAADAFIKPAYRAPWKFPAL